MFTNLSRDYSEIIGRVSSESNPAYAMQLSRGYHLSLIPLTSDINIMHIFSDYYEFASFIDPAID
jgi:hypothetical protein